MRIRTILASTLLGVSAALAAGVPAKADSYQEIQAGCDTNWGIMIDAQYWHTVNGTQYGVYATRDWQYVGGSSSNCEDINVSPNFGGGYYMTSAYARTHMCNSSGSCWYNSWRWCGGGCVTATDMVNGTRYSIHIAFLSVGTDYLLMQD